jgi:hypothetical protein
VERTNLAGDPAQAAALDLHRAALDGQLRERTRPSAAKPLMAMESGKKKKKGGREPVSVDD